MAIEEPTSWAQVPLSLTSVSRQNVEKGKTSVLRDEHFGVCFLFAALPVLGTHGVV